MPAPGPKSGEEPKTWSSTKVSASASAVSPPDVGEGDGARRMVVAAWRPWRPRAGDEREQQPAEGLHAAGEKTRSTKPRTARTRLTAPSSTHSAEPRAAARPKPSAATRRRPRPGCRSSPGRRSRAAATAARASAPPARRSRPAARSGRPAARRPRAARAAPAWPRRPVRRPSRRSGCPCPTRRRSAPGAARRGRPAPPRRPRRRHPGAATDAAWKGREASPKQS